MKLITLASLVASLVVVNILFRWALQRIKIRNLAFDYFKRFVPVLEIIGWSAFTIWLLNILFATYSYYQYIQLAIIILVVVIIAWFLLRDFVAGGIIKARFNLTKGQKIRYNTIDGEVRKTGLLALTIRDENGADMIIPYTKVNQKDIRLNYSKNGNTETSFTVTIKSQLNSNDLSSKMQELIINSAFCSTKHKPKIQVIEEIRNRFQIEVTCQPISGDGIEKLKLMLEQNLENN